MRVTDRLLVDIVVPLSCWLDCKIISNIKVIMIVSVNLTETFYEKEAAIYTHLHQTFNFKFRFYSSSEGRLRLAKILAFL